MTAKIGDEVLWVADTPSSYAYSYLRIVKIENGVVHAVGYSEGEDIYQTCSEKHWDAFAQKHAK